MIASVAKHSHQHPRPVPHLSTPIRYRCDEDGDCRSTLASIRRSTSIPRVVIVTRKRRRSVECRVREIRPRSCKPSTVATTAAGAMPSSFYSSY
jgi:hypothetical protein